MRLSYLYDLDLPSPLAAAIQILRTCSAACEQGARADVYVRTLRGSAEECLAGYGLHPQPALRLRLLPMSRGRIRLRQLCAMLAEQDGSERHAILSRGEPGISLLPSVAQGRSDTQRVVYEAHRLSYPHRLEERSPPRSILHRPAALARARLARRREAATLRTVDGIICLTPGVLHALEQEFGVDRPTLILSSGTEVAGGAVPGDEDRDLDVLYVGKTERRKGVPLLLEAMRSLPNRRACIAGGTGEQVRELAARAHELGVGEQVQFRGQVQHAAVGTLYARARVGVCPLPAGVSRISDEFTSPLKLLELMAHGVPIVASDVPAVRALVEHNRSALLVPPNDPEALAAGIERLLVDRTLAHSLAREGRLRVRDFSWERRADKLLRFVEALP